MPQRHKDKHTDENDEAARHFMGADELAHLAVDDSSDCLAMWASVEHCTDEHPDGDDIDIGAGAPDPAGSAVHTRAHHGTSEAARSESK